MERCKPLRFSQMEGCGDCGRTWKPQTKSLKFGKIGEKKTGLGDDYRTRTCIVPGVYIVTLVPYPKKKPIK